ncbi:hypothetical protein NG895_00440 [Aeoliella sp. ICT_H6.2]|uniref:Uncharacterized protein n=1 Tax=Aeoliella straminimaris TaxID=2954799 RepID=A0A9X2F511_9BACT|nr:hypothetical protein [Aeoliella straminimaris]MCO6042362.1 hypothetical protein [Aeoliella straminimaris]
MSTAMTECCSDTSDRAREIVQEHPEESIIAAFVTGAVVGVAVGIALTARIDGASRSRRGVTDQLSHEMSRLGGQMSHLAEKLIPDTVSKAFSR